jgi:hypothetical protein
MNELRDCSRDPGHFRNRVTGEEVTALQWRRWNHYPICKFLEDGEDDVCAYTFDKEGNMILFTIEGALPLGPMDWIVKQRANTTNCSAAMFDEMFEELP